MSTSAINPALQNALLARLRQYGALPANGIGAPGMPVGARPQPIYSGGVPMNGTPAPYRPVTVTPPNAPIASPIMGGAETLSANRAPMQGTPSPYVNALRARMGLQ